MSFAAGALSKVLVGQTTASLSSAAATGGSSPYTYQWYRSTTNGFSPGAGNLVSGATALTLLDSGLTPGTTYYYVVVVTDTGNSNVTTNSSQLTVATETGQTQNQLAQNSMVGVVDMRVGSTNIISCQVDSSVTTQIYPGQAVKIVAATTGGIPKVAPCTANADSAIGFAVFNVKDVQYTAGQNLEVAMFGSVVWCWATGAITQMARACLDYTYVGGVQATGSTATVMGWALDGCSAAGLIRVMILPNATFSTA